MYNILCIVINCICLYVYSCKFMIVGTQNEGARKPLPAGAVRVLPASSGQWSGGSGKMRSGESAGGREGEAYGGEGERESDDVSPWDRYGFYIFQLARQSMLHTVGPVLNAS